MKLSVKRWQEVACMLILYWKFVKKELWDMNFNMFIRGPLLLCSWCGASVREILEAKSNVCDLNHVDHDSALSRWTSASRMLHFLNKKSFSKLISSFRHFYRERENRWNHVLDGFDKRRLKSFRFESKLTLLVYRWKFRNLWSANTNISLAFSSKSPISSA